MMVRAFEVGLVALIGLALLVSVLRDVVRQAWSAAADAEAGRLTAAERDELRRRRAGWIGGTLFAVAIVNGLAYQVHSAKLGGSADSRTHVEGRYHVSAGGQEYTEGNGPAPIRAEGRYYVSSHNRYTQVTEQQWRAVRTHQFALYVTHGLMFLVSFPLLAYSQGWWARGARGTRNESPPSPHKTEDSA